MISRLFEVLKLLEERRIGFFIERDRADGLTITAVLVGKRVEISVTEDDMVDVAVFRGDESAKSGWAPCLRRSKKTNRDLRCNRSVAPFTTARSRPCRRATRAAG